MSVAIANAINAILEPGAVPVTSIALLSAETRAIVLAVTGDETLRSGIEACSTGLPTTAKQVLAFETMASRHGGQYSKLHREVRSLMAKVSGSAHKKTYREAVVQQLLSAATALEKHAKRVSADAQNKGKKASAAATRVSAYRSTDLSEAIYTQLKDVVDEDDIRIQESLAGKGVLVNLKDGAAFAVTMARPLRDGTTQIAVRLGSQSNFNDMLPKVKKLFDFIESNDLLKVENLSWDQKRPDSAALSFTIPDADFRQHEFAKFEAKIADRIAGMMAEIGDPI